MLPYLLGLPVVDRADIDSVAPAVVHAAVTDLVRSALGVEVDGPATLEAIDYPSQSPATGSLHRLSGLDRSGKPWSLFCKELQHVRHWPLLALLPPALAHQFAADFPWRSELDLWDTVPDRLPPGLRVPTLYRRLDLDDDRLALWMEDIRTESTWELSTFARAAHLLGRWNARSCDEQTLATSAFPPGFALRMYVEEAVPVRGLAPLADDEIWAHPWLADQADLRAELRRLGAGIAADLDRLDTLPQAMPHGDASPQNLLPPADGSAEFVVIDVSFRSPHALGFDLGQLLVGLVHAGQWPVEDLAAVARTILPAYLDGLAAEGMGGLDEQVDDGFRTSVMLRSGFDALPYGALTAPDDDGRIRAEFDRRLQLTRFLVGQRSVGFAAPAQR